MTEEFSESRVTWGDDGWAASSGWAQVHCADALTMEYLGAQEVWVSVGTGLPAGAWLEAPPAPEADKAVVRQADGWALVADYRGVTVYDTATGQPLEVTALGPLPDTHTLLAPASPYDVWTGAAWQRDEAAAEQAVLSAAQGEQAGRIALANGQIAILAPAVDGGYAKPAHTQLLADWQRCRYELTLVPEQPGWPDKPKWPAEPDKVI